MIAVIAKVTRLVQNSEVVLTMWVPHRDGSAASVIGRREAERLAFVAGQLLPLPSQTCRQDLYRGSQPDATCREWRKGAIRRLQASRTARRLRTAR